MISGQLLLIPQRQRYIFQMVNYYNEVEIPPLPITIQTVMNKVHMLERFLVTSFREKSFKIRQKIRQATVEDIFGNVAQSRVALREVQEEMKQFLMFYNDIYIFSQPWFNGLRRPSSIFANMAGNLTEYRFNWTSLYAISLRTIHLIRLDHHWRLFPGRAMIIQPLEQNQLILRMWTPWLMANLLNQAIQAQFRLFFFNLEDNTQGCFMENSVHEDHGGLIINNQLFQYSILGRKYYDDGN